MPDHSKDIAANRMADTDRAWMYWLKSQPWLPHYTETGVYVSPGGVERKESELIALRAIKKETILWPRRWQTEKVKMR